MKLEATKHFGWTLAAAATLLLACAGMNQDQDNDDDDEIVKSINDVPAAVREAATRVCGKDIKQISKESEDGELLYEFEFVRNGAPASATFSESGVLSEIEQTIAVSKLPAALTASIQNRYPGATIEQAEEIETHGLEVLIKVGGKKLEIDASASGRMAEEEGDEEGDEEGEEEEEEEGRK